MADIKISGNTLNLAKDHWEEVVEHTNSFCRIILVGIIRAEKSPLAQKLGEILSGSGTERKNAIRELFLQVKGDYALVIEEEKAVSLFLGYSCPQFYMLTDQENGLLLTQNEATATQDGFDQERLFLRYTSKQGLFIPKGIGKTVSDYLLPGMALIFDKENREYEQTWIIEIGDFCTRDDHENLAGEIADAFVDELESFRFLEGDLKLELSSGVDSALLLAAAHASGIDIQPVNYRPCIRSGESAGAKRMADHFNLPLTMLYRGPGSADNIFTPDTDITDYLNKMEPLLKSGSAMFILDNVSLLSAYEFGFHNALQGSSYPTALCIAHYTSYPKHKSFFSKKFIPNVNHEKRHFFSIDYTKSRINRDDYEDVWGIGDKYPFIDSYYWEFLNPCFTGTSKSSSMHHILTELIDTDDALLTQGLRSRGYSIIDKILLDPNTRTALSSPSAHWASKLMKLIVFIHNNCWATSKTFNYRQAGLMSEFQAGLSSNILTRLLNVQIDDKLVNYPKWHIFRAFELLAGKSFFEISYASGDLSFARSELLKKIRYKLSGADSERPTLIENKSVWKFIKDKHLESTHGSILETHALSSKLESTEAARNPALSKGTRFWYLNNILNISSLKTG